MQRGQRAELSGPLQRPHFPHGPLALMDTAAVALQPGFRTIANVAREEVAAGEPVLRVGVGDRRDRPARAGVGVFPRLARVLFGAGKHNRSGSLCVGKVVLTRGRGPALGRRRRRSGSERSGLIGFLVFAEERIELVAAAAGRGAKCEGERDRLGTQPP